MAQQTAGILQLNAKIAVDGADAKKVAADYLTSKALVADRHAGSAG
jgi:glycine betaine/choline ABC-type transport system substrate-binding protein